MSQAWKRAALAGVAVAVIFAAQYIVVSNVDSGIYSLIFSDFTYGEVYSYIPLPRPAVKSVWLMLQLASYPLPLVAELARERPRGLFARAARAALTPFKEPKRNHLILAAFNTILWSATVLLLVRAGRFLRVSRQQARRRALVIAGLAVIALTILAAFRFWYPPEITVNSVRPLP